MAKQKNRDSIAGSKSLTGDNSEHSEIFKEVSLGGDSSDSGKGGGSETVKAYGAPHAICPTCHGKGNQYGRSGAIVYMRCTICGRTWSVKFMETFKPKK